MWRKQTWKARTVFANLVNVVDVLLGGVKSPCRWIDEFVDGIVSNFEIFLLINVDVLKIKKE